MVEILETHRFEKQQPNRRWRFFLVTGCNVFVPTLASPIICISSSQNQDNRQCNYHSNAHDTLKALKVNRNKETQMWSYFPSWAGQGHVTCSDVIKNSDSICIQKWQLNSPEMISSSLLIASRCMVASLDSAASWSAVSGMAFLRSEPAPSVIQR